MRNKTVHVNYKRQLVPKKFGKGYKEKFVKTDKTVVKTNAKGNSELDVIAGMKGKNQLKALKSRNINKTITGLNVGTQTLGGVTSLSRSLGNLSKYDSGTKSEQQNINGGMQTADTSREEDSGLGRGDDIA